MCDREALLENLYGVDSHVHILHALEGLSVDQVGARPAAVPFSIHQLVEHMIYWQAIGVARVTGLTPPYPVSSSEGWTAPAQPSAAAWESACRRFADGLADLKDLVSTVDLDAIVEPNRQRSARQNVYMVMGHNSYHLGQIVLIRHLLGAWPPPKGGVSW